MLSSMTAYGRAFVSSSFGRLVITLQSVNRRHLEIAVIAPRELSLYEIDIRRWVGEVIGRGQVTVRVEAAFESKAPVQVRPNLPMVRQLKAAWEEIGAVLGKEIDSSTLCKVLAGDDGLLCYETDLANQALYRSAIQEALEKALEGFVSMRRKEGAELARDMLERLQLMKDSMQSVRELANRSVEKYRQRLEARVRELVPGAPDHDERLAREVCLYADRCDYTEEVIRFDSHVKQFESLLRDGKPCIGKTLEFMTQEMQREVNTIGSKAQDSDVAKHVVLIKAELERIREQLQNVE